MATTPSYINARINNLQAQINAIISGGVPTTSDLDVVLGNGNSAGAFDIDMNSNDILQVNNIDTVTINGGGLASLTLPSPVTFTNAVAPICNANPQNPLDLCNKQYVDAQSVLTAYQLYFNYSVPYTVPLGATYSELSSVQVVVPQTIGFATSSTAPQLLQGFFNLLTNLNITSIPAGVFTLLAFANLNNISMQGRIAFFYTIIGTDATGAETILYTSPASLLLNTITPLIGSVSIQGTVPLLSLVGFDGLGIKLFIQSSTATATSGSVFYQTPNSYSSILTSVLPISAVSPLSQVLLTGNSAGATSIDMNNNDVINVSELSTENITALTPFNFSVISIYADATARNTALPTPYLGQFAFLTNSNELQYYNGGWFGFVNPVVPIITGFTLGSTFEFIFLNAAGTVIGAPINGGFTVARFYPTTTTSGTIVMPESVAITFLVVGGGGGGGPAISFVFTNGGGGGAGGLLTANDNMVIATSYALTVGGGGAGQPAGGAGSGASGANSSLVVASGTKTASGGGGGGRTAAGLGGGSGGGGGTNGAAPQAGGAGTVSQGNNGGSSLQSGSNFAGGGGGNSSVGGGSGTQGNGGTGTANTITGASLFYAGGGGGGSSATVSNGGSGVGGNGGFTGTPNATTGTDGTGSGGGGGGATTGSGFKGGSGTVIIKFPSFR